jgi:hypothetical protein
MMTNKFKVGDEVTFTGVVHGGTFIGFWHDNELTDEEIARGLSFQVIKARVAAIHFLGFYCLEFTKNGSPVGLPFAEEDLQSADSEMAFLAKEF